MKRIELRLIEAEELDAAIQLEQRCYTPEAAATFSGFQFRYKHYRTFFWSAWLGSELIGITNGIRTAQTECGDEMKGEHTNAMDGPNFCVLTVAVAPEHRRLGAGSLLLHKLIEQCEKSHIDTIILMCEQHLIPFYERQKFKLNGISDSSHGGIEWYEMSRRLHTMEHLTE